MGKKVIHEAHIKLNQFYATAICGNDILSSIFYVAGIATVYAGIYAPFVLAFIALVLFFYKSVYTEVVEALPTNGGAYNCLLNATSKNLAALAGTTTVLSYVATSVISGESAMQYLYSIAHTPVIPLTIVVLAIFALLVISGIKDSAKVALGIFALHVVVLTAFVILGAWYFLHGGQSYFMANFTASIPLVQRVGGVLPALFFGFAASLLGVSGYESSANFVEEQDRGVFRKTLRNMLIFVAIFNPLIALLAQNAMPFHSLLTSKDFLLSNVAHIFGGTIFQYIVVIDAVLVLCGAVLTGFVGVSGLVYRMTTDGCFPAAFAKVNKKGSYPYIIIAFFILCTSILLLTHGDLLSLAGVYTIAFLSVMTLFAFGNLLMRETRKDLKRTYQAPLLFVVLAFFSTAAGILGNVEISPANVHYFLSYFIPAAIIVYGTIYLDFVLKFLARLTMWIPALSSYFRKLVTKLNDNGEFVVFIHHTDRLYKILDYIDRNEIGRKVYLIHCNNTGDKKEHAAHYKEIESVLPILKKTGVFPEFDLQIISKDAPFGPEIIDEVANELHVAKNKILIGSIHDEHPFDYAELGGVRIIF